MWGRLTFVIAMLAAATGAQAATYQVGPGRPFTSLQAVADLLNPGDVVEVDGSATYPGGVVFERPGTAQQKIVIRGIRVSGRRPILSGGTNTVTFATPDPDVPAEAGSHYLFEGFELTGGSFRCLYHQADDLTVRDVLVHDCPAHGILGADQGSGSCLLEDVEVHNTGAGDSRHQIYMATDEVHHPGSVFRMRHCYIHDGNGGNNVKSRAERNEIEYNWIEGAFYHELELIGPDPFGAPAGWSEDLAREDSDVVGNVLWQRNTFYVTRLGGDATGQSNGRYRFVNNTVIAGTSAAFRLFDGLQSVEMHNNVFHGASGGGVNMVREIDAVWTNGSQIAGSNNWASSGSTNVPAAWTGTRSGPSPGFVSMAGNDLRPVAGSPLLNAGDTDPQTPAVLPFPAGHFPPEFDPPQHAVESVHTGRAFDCDLDIGAFERPPSQPAVWMMGWDSALSLSWPAVSGAAGYDLVKGSLSMLRVGAGDFSSSLLACLENDGADLRATDAVSPPAGDGFFYLLRSLPGGTYDTACADLAAPRDSGVAGSPSACP